MMLPKSTFMLQDQHPGKLHTEYKYIPHTHTHTFAHTVSNSKAPIRKQIMNLLRKDWVGGVQHKGEVNSSVLELTQVSKRMSSDLLLIDCYTFPMISCVFVVFTYKKISNIKREKSVFFKEISRCGH